MTKVALWTLLFAMVMVAVELCIIARARTGAFDPRCLLPRGYVIEHFYEAGKETRRCVPDAQ